MGGLGFWGLGVFRFWVWGFGFLGFGVWGLGAWGLGVSSCQALNESLDASYWQGLWQSQNARTRHLRVLSFVQVSKSFQLAVHVPGLGAGLRPELLQFEKLRFRVEGSGKV